MTPRVGGNGFDRDFLPFPVDLPLPHPGIADDLTPVPGGTVLPYTHFSLAMSRSRRLARWVAWNIDGLSLHTDIHRDGMHFRADRRIPAEAQTLNATYTANRLDRSHLARRADLLWGSAPEAEQANRDSFYFTNITPQMDNFNQSRRVGVWGRLENALLKVVDHKRASVLAGPVLAADDPPYRGGRVPREFWKLLAYVLDDRPRVRIFLVTQSLVLGVLPDQLAEFETYEITLDELTARTHFTFSDTLRANIVVEPRGAHDVWGRLPIRRAESIWW